MPLVRSKTPFAIAVTVGERRGISLDHWDFLSHEEPRPGPVPQHLAVAHPSAAATAHPTAAAAFADFMFLDKGSHGGLPHEVRAAQLRRFVGSTARGADSATRGGGNGVLGEVRWEGATGLTD